MKTINIKQDYDFMAKVWKLYRQYAEVMNEHVKQNKVMPDDFWLNWIKESTAMVEENGDTKFSRDLVLAFGKKLDYIAKANDILTVKKVTA